MSVVTVPISSCCQSAGNASNYGQLWKPSAVTWHVLLWRKLPHIMPCTPLQQGGALQHHIACILLGLTTYPKAPKPSQPCGHIMHQAQSLHLEPTRRFSSWCT